MPVMNLNQGEYSTAQKASGLVAERHNGDMVQEFLFTQRPNRNVPGTLQAKAKQHLSFPPPASSSFILQHLLFPIALTQWQTYFQSECDGKED